MVGCWLKFRTALYTLRLYQNQLKLLSCLPVTSHFESGCCWISYGAFPCWSSGPWRSCCTWFPHHKAICGCSAQYLNQLSEVCTLKVEHPIRHEKSFHYFHHSKTPELNRVQLLWCMLGCKNMIKVIAFPPLFHFLFLLNFFRAVKVAARLYTAKHDHSMTAIFT